MKLMDKRIIYVLLISIIILASVLLYKVYTTPNYDKEFYEEVYAEYNEIIEKVNNNTEITFSDNNDEEMSNNTVQSTTQTYKENNIVALIKISKINLFYPVIAETTMDNLKIAPTKLWGNEPNTIGNFCIIGHNYRDWNQFSKLNQLKNGDIVELTDSKGNSLLYSVYDIYTVSPDDLNCTSQKTNGKKEITLITCTKDSKERLVVKCMEKI